MAQEQALERISEQQLVTRINRALEALTQAESVDEMLNLHDQAEAFQSLIRRQVQSNELRRRAVAIRLNGIDSEPLTPDQVKAWCPIINTAPDVRHPVVGGMLQRRGGTARHDAVAWGYARAADARGVDIIQNCEVSGIRCEAGRVTGVETSRGTIKARKVGIAVAGHSSVLAAMAGFRLPIESFPLQALVSEPIKPVLHTVVISKAKHIYVSQSDKGELVMGATRDTFNSYAQRGCFSIIEEQLAALKALFPIFSRLRMMRQWSGIVDICADSSPIIGKTPVEGLYIDCGWGMGGFKATPGVGLLFAHTIATGEPHPVIAPFTLERFAAGRLIDEQSAVGGQH